MTSAPAAVTVLPAAGGAGGGSGGGTGHVTHDGSSGDGGGASGSGGGGADNLPPEPDGFAAYSTALSATVAIGCTLLLLNMLVFACVFRQRDKVSELIQLDTVSVTYRLQNNCLFVLC